MAAPPRSKWTRADYERDAREYMASLPLEHFMESTPQATQREVTSSAFALARTRIPGFHYFNELLIHGRKGEEFLRVCPDNMVVLGDISDEARTSYPLDLEPAPVFWVLEYVSESNKRKDYVENFEKYEKEVKVPYYLIFHPDEQDLQLYRHNGERYIRVAAEPDGKLTLPEIDMQVGLHGGWVRYWHRGELLPTQTELDEQLRQREKLLHEREDELRQRDDQLRQRDDQLRQREDQLRQRDDQLRQRDDQLRQRDEQLDALVVALRPIVEARARQASRSDILEQLPHITDGQQLTRWLAELA